MCIQAGRIVTGLVASAFALTSHFASALDVTVKSDETYTLDTSNNKDSTFVLAEGGATIVLPSDTGSVNARILINDGGTVNVIRPADGGASTVRLINGIRAEAGSSVSFGERIASVQIGRGTVTDDKEYPVCDFSKVQFADPKGKVVLRDKVTLRHLPSDCPVSVNDDATVALQGDGDLMGFLTADGTLALDRYDVICCTAESLGKDCRINVNPGRTLSFRTCTADGWGWKDVSGSTGFYRVKLMGKGARVLFRGSDTRVRCEAEIAGEGEVVFVNENADGKFRTFFRNVSYMVRKKQKPIVLSVSDARTAAPTESWKAKVAHWFDADDASTLVRLAYDFSGVEGWQDVKSEFEGHPIVIGWTDVLSGTNGVCLYNDRVFKNGGPLKDSGGYVLYTMPYLVEGGLNGRNYVSCGQCNATTNNARYVDGKLKSATERRRLLCWEGEVSPSVRPAGSATSFLSPYCIMVYGSHLGGGRAMLGTDGADEPSHGNLGRNDSKISQPWVAHEGFSMVADGRIEDPQKAKPDGGWQIVAIDMTDTNTYVNAIGRSKSDELSGGQNYAEIIFFREKPTPAERFACETYLAEKWGLTDKYMPRDASSFVLTGQSNAEMELWDYENQGYNANAEVTVSGDFVGQVTVPQGRTLVIDGKPAPPKDGDLPSEGRVGWFDPSFDGALDLYGADESESNCVDGVRFLYGRTLGAVDKADGAYVLCTSDSASKGKPHDGRSPYKVEEAKGRLTVTPVRTWMDFSKNGVKDTKGNVLRFLKRPNESTGAGAKDFKTLTIRQGFMALDTSLGGGNPIGGDADFSAGIYPRANDGTEVSDPIWTVTNSVAMSGTWLDTESVEGTARGFNGCGEVLSFETAQDFGVGAIGCRLGDKLKNREIVGEILLYSVPLSEAERIKVQGYLMYKWFGDLDGRYSDLSAVTIVGEGTVKVPDFGLLPSLGDGFTGSVAFGGPVLSLRSDETVEIPRSVRFADELDVSLTIVEPLDPGTYVLLRADGEISGAGKINVTVSGGDGGSRYRIVRDGSVLKMNVKGDGLRIIVK